MNPPSGTVHSTPALAWALAKRYTKARICLSAMTADLKIKIFDNKYFGCYFDNNDERSYRVLHISIKLLPPHLSIGIIYVKAIVVSRTQHCVLLVPALPMMTFPRTYLPSPRYYQTEAVLHVIQAPNRQEGKNLGKVGLRLRRANEIVKRWQDYYKFVYGFQWDKVGVRQALSLQHWRAGTLKWTFGMYFATFKGSVG